MSNLSVKIEQNTTQSKARLTPYQATKTNPKIRESVFHFAAPIGEIIPDIPYLCEPSIIKAKRAIFLFFPSFEDKLRLKTLNL
jgi:hypothetical protein